MKELKLQLISALLVILTVAAVVCAGINFQQQERYAPPEDGAIWVDRPAGVRALDVPADSPAYKAGVRTDDVLIRINNIRVEKAIDVAQILLGVRAWNKAEYIVKRSSVEVKATVYIAERAEDSAVLYLYVVAVAYLGIGLFVYFRRGTSRKAIHFYILCLASFILCSFHYTGKLNGFDRVIYWGNVAAGLFAPTIFLHFCLAFPEPRRWMRRFGALVLYVPAALVLAIYAGFSSGTLKINVPLLELRWILDRGWLLLLCGFYLGGAAVLSNRYRKPIEDPIVRQQLKWLRNGAVLGVAPFTAIYALPYIFGVIPGPYLESAVFSLILVPLTWAYAILRYRLMDVDVIFQQGYAYTLATLAVLGVFFGLIFSLGKWDDIQPSAAILLLLIATFVFQPIRNWIQEQLDRYYFYKDRYDYRLTLVQFARELGSETDLDRMLTSVADRLIDTISLQHLGIFIVDEESGRFQLKAAAGVKNDKPYAPAANLDLSFLTPDSKKNYLFFERTRHPLDIVSHDLPPSVRNSIAELGLTYYVPCSVRGRTIAYLGISRTDKGDFLTSDDLELLLTLSGPFGIAIENARLYHSLQRKVEEYERLKEFSENIVESINVGILAADLEDRVESWNSQIERLTGISREMALGRRLSDLFPPELNTEFNKVRSETGIHHIYKFTLKPDLLPASADRRQIAGVNGNGHAHIDRESILNLAIAPLISKDYHQIGRLIIFDDITERAELEHRLVQADKLSSIGLLAAGVAHEVNTPLAVISTYAQMLAKQISGDDQKAKLLEKIARQTFRASEIVNSLLNFSRTSPAEFDEVDLNRVIRETINLIEHQLSSAHIQVQLNLDTSLPTIKGNQGKLQQVFLNLFLNARDAMDKGGVLAVRSWADDSSVRVEVADSGQGISNDHLARIYDPFFTTKLAKKGTGLGLSVTYGIVKEHGGGIEVESQAGAGTRFQLDFPMSRKPVNA